MILGRLQQQDTKQNNSFYLTLHSQENSTKTHETPEFTVCEYLKYREFAENKQVVI